MGIQEIILGIIILLCFIWTIRRIVLCFKRIKRGNNPCEGCPCGCTMHKKDCPNEKK